MKRLHNFTIFLMFVTVLTVACGGSNSGGDDSDSEVDTGDISQELEAGLNSFGITNQEISDCLDETSITTFEDTVEEIGESAAIDCCQCLHDASDAAGQEDSNCEAGIAECDGSDTFDDCMVVVSAEGDGDDEGEEDSNGPSDAEVQACEEEAGLEDESTATVSADGAVDFCECIAPVLECETVFAACEEDDPNKLIGDCLDENLGS